MHNSHYNLKLQSQKQRTAFQHFLDHSSHVQMRSCQPYGSWQEHDSNQDNSTNASCKFLLSELENMVTSVFSAPDKAQSSILTQVLIKTEACLS